MSGHDDRFGSLRRVIERLRGIHGDEFSRNMAEVLERELAQREAADVRPELDPGGPPAGVPAGESAVAE